MNQVRETLNLLAERGPHHDPETMIRAALDRAAVRHAALDHAATDQAPRPESRVRPVVLAAVASAAAVAVVAGGMWLLRSGDAGETIAADDPTMSNTALPETPSSTDGTSSAESPITGPAYDLAAALDAQLIVAADGDTVKILRRTDGQWSQSVIDQHGFNGFWSADSQFVYAHAERSWLWDLDANLRCEVDGEIHRVLDAQAPEVVVVGPELRPSSSEHGPYEYPTTRHNCETGMVEPISPVRFGDGETEMVDLRAVGDATVVLRYDAEGNADVHTDLGIDLDGDDYAGYHAFHESGTLVAYGHMTGAMGPHLTDRIVVRDGATGEMLWDLTLDAPLRKLLFAGDQLIVQLYSSEGTASEGGGPTAQEPAPLLVVDAQRGEIKAELSSGVDVLTIGF